MRNMMGFIPALGLVAMLGACGDDDEGKKDTSDTTTATDSTPTDTSTTETQAETTGDDVPDTVETTYATLTFSIDDSANKTFEAADKLAWKGSFTWDSTSNVITFDSTWGGGAGPYPLLYDDGPAPAGHEAPGATAGDNIWTTVVKIATPDEALELEYGAAFGDGASNWIWSGQNGKVTVPADSTSQVDATGLTITPHGKMDLILTLDVSNNGENLSGEWQGETYTAVKVKSSAWYWAEIAAVDNGEDGDAVAADGIFTMQLSENLTKHTGLLKRGSMPQFVFVVDGVEYKDPTPPTAGVGAVATDGTTEVELEVKAMAEGDKNTYVEMPSQVRVSFQIDDTANKTYEAGDGLSWKGSFKYDSTTKVLEHNGSWEGPYVPMSDAGPSEEGPGTTADDNIWTASVLVENAPKEFEYGAERAGGQWIWIGGNGKFTVPEDTLTPIVATGLVIPAFGDIDMRLVIDVSGNGANLFTDFQTVDYTGKVKVKGSAWAWGEIAAVDDGTKGDATANDGKYTFVFSELKTKNDGLLKPGATPEWVFVLDGSEYKGGDPQKARNEGVTAWTDAGGTGADACVTVTAACVAATPGNAGNGNSMITVPGGN
ncbi:MAG: hypothetical protein IT385_04515 [Deltaproteobacteria bacterium]|nr:hypothetical protein [Deltaproteobacteria bacterium]